MNAQKELLELISRIREFGKEAFPEGCRFHINLDSDTTVWVFGCKDHDAGLQVKRTLEIKDAKKNTYDPDNPYHVLTGKINSDVSVYIACQGLPPMCRIETYEEEVPKEQIVQTGEKTIVRRTRIRCGEEK